MNNEKKEYLAPEITIVSLDAGDMLTSSGGYDGTDNWSDDIFSGPHLGVVSHPQGISRRASVVFCRFQHFKFCKTERKAIRPKRRTGKYQKSRRQK